MSDELHSLSGAYVLDALTDEERTDFEAHQRRCTTCREEVDSLREVAPLLAETVETVPPPALRTSILALAHETRQDPPPVSPDAPRTTAGDDIGVAPTTEGTVTPLRRRRRWAALAAAAALLVGGGVTWQVVDEATTSVTEQVADADDAETWTVQSADGGTVEVTRSESVGHAVLRLKGLADPGDGRAYQAWLQDEEGDLVSAGVMDDADGELVLDGDVDTARGVGVSEEPAGGSQQPTTDPIALVELG